MVSRISKTATLARGATVELPFEERFQRQGYHLAEFGVFGNGSNNDTAALLNALTSGEHVYGSKGMQIRTDAPINPTLDGFSVDFDGRGCEILSDTGTYNLVSVLDFNNPYDTPLSVSAIETVAADLSYGGSTSSVSRLTVASTSTIPVGSIVKVISNAKIPQSPASLNERVGEYAVVLAKTSTTLTLNMPLEEAHSGNIRVARMRAEYDCNIRNVKGRRAASQPASQNTKFIAVRGFVGARIHDIDIADFGDDGVALHGCYDWEVSVRARNMQSRDSEFRTCYGVIPYSSSFGTIQARGMCHRHLVTSGVRSTAEDSDDIAHFGRCADVLVHDSHAVGMGNAPFDTHWDAKRWKFSNCHAHRGYNGNQAPAGPGIQIRGTDCVVEGGSVRNGGLRFQTVTDSNTPTSNMAKGLTCETDNNQRVLEVLGDGAKTTAELWNCKFMGDATRIADLKNCEVLGWNSSIGSKRDNTDTTYLFYKTGDVLVRWLDSKIDLRRLGAGGTFRLALEATDACDTRIKGGHWIGFTGREAQVQIASMNNVNGKCRVIDVRSDLASTLSSEFVSTGGSSEVTSASYSTDGY